MTKKKSRDLICGGDFNIRLNPKIVSSNGKSDTKNISRRLNTWMREAGIVDVWREINPMSRNYSHYASAHNVYSRITFLCLKEIFLGWITVKSDPVLFQIMVPSICQSIWIIIRNPLSGDWIQTPWTTQLLKMNWKMKLNCIWIITIMKKWPHPFSGKH